MLGIQQLGWVDQNTYVAGDNLPSWAQEGVHYDDLRKFHLYAIVQGVEEPLTEEQFPLQHSVGKLMAVKNEVTSIVTLEMLEDGSSVDVHASNIVYKHAVAGRNPGDLIITVGKAVFFAKQQQSKDVHVGPDINDAYFVTQLRTMVMAWELTNGHTNAITATQSNLVEQFCDRLTDQALDLGTPEKVNAFCASMITIPKGFSMHQCLLQCMQCQFGRV